MLHSSCEVSLQLRLILHSRLDSYVDTHFRLTVKEHAEVWKGTWAAYKASFQGLDAPDVEAEKKRQAEEKAKVCTLGDP